MQNLRFAAITSMIGLLPLTSLAQIADTGAKYLVLEKIIYHSSHCNGTCPALDLEIDSNYDVLLKRDIWTAKGESDKRRSGNFKGKIDPRAYFNLFATLVRSNYLVLKFPPIYCCDGSVTTIIIYANGKRTELSSMLPPKEAQKLIGVLHDLALNLNIPSTAEDIKIEQ